MEFVIPGLMLVAFMVWASTQIKRTAAQAFEPETIETDNYVIEKPEGFLHVLNDDSGLAFHAYSKTFSKVGKKDVRQVTVEVRIFESESFDKRNKQIEAETELVSLKTPYIDSGEKAMVIETKKIKNGVEMDTFYKLVTRGKRLLEMRVSVISQHREENLDRIEKMLDGFSVK